MACDLCGKSGSTTKTRIEGIVYDACADCAKLGTDATPAQPKKRSSSKSKKSSYRGDEDVYVRPDAGRVLREKREKESKNQQEFAQRLNVKESLLHAWETGERTPTVKMARRLERQLHVSLTQSGSPDGGDAVEYISGRKSSGGSLTIGDMLKKS